MASINEVKNRIDFTALSSVTITSDGMQRGSTMQPSAQGVYIYKDGSIEIADMSAALRIVRQGGDGAWEGVKKDEHFGNGFTPQQDYAVSEIVDFIFKNIDPEKVAVTYD